MADRKPRDVVALIERHGRDMKQVSARLRDLVSTLQSNKDQMSGQRSAALADSASMPPRTDPETVSRLERRVLEAELAQTRERLARAAAELGELQRRVAEVEAEHRRITDQVVEAEEQASELAQLHASLRQIHEADGYEPLLQALQEVVINVIGSEELAIFDLQGDQLRLVRSFGIDAGELQRIPLGRGPIGRAASSGRTYLAAGDEPAEDPALTACLPLKADGVVVGAIAIFGLLAHKPGLTPFDHALFELLIPHGGQALALRKAGTAAA